MIPPKLGRGLADLSLPYVDVKHRFEQLIWRPLTHPWLPTWSATKALENGSATDYYLKWFVLSTVLYAIGDDIRAWFAERSDDGDKPPKPPEEET